MIIRIHHEGRVYEIQAPDGCQLSRHGHKPAVLGESLDDVLRVPTPEGEVSLPTPLVVHCAKQGRFGLTIVGEADS